MARKPKVKIKSIKGYGITTARGRLRHEVFRQRKGATLAAGASDQIVRVEIRAV